MIQLHNLCKTYHLGGRAKVVADNINAIFPTGSTVALMGRNGAGKSSLLRMIAGTMNPTSGRITSTGSISWPVGFSGSFHGELTGAQNCCFIARAYGVDSEELMAFTQDFAELGGHFHLPFRSYSSGMRSRLAFGVSMGIRFDTYLVDEVTSVGDANFKAKSKAVFRDRMRNSGGIVVSHSMGMMRSLCEAGAILEDGQLTYYPDIEDALDRHKFNMGVD